MKKIKRLSALLIFSFVLLLPLGKVYAEERSIYIGDLINIKIATQDITENDIKDKFAEFEIVKLKEVADGYLITLRSFEPGEKMIQIGNEELKITVKSTLDDINRKDVFEGGLSTQKAGASMDWQYAFYAAALIFIVTGGITIFRFVRRKKMIALTPYQRFLHQTSQINLAQDSCLVQMNLLLKEYLEVSYFCSIKGKTSEEILKELSVITKLQVYLQPIGTWFGKCDYLKFTKVMPTMELKQAILEELKELVTNMEKAREVEV